jgi:hypothetical protein
MFFVSRNAVEQALVLAPDASWPRVDMIAAVEPKSGIWNRKGAKDTKENKKLQCERRSPRGEYRH